MIIVLVSVKSHRYNYYHNDYRNNYRNITGRRVVMQFAIKCLIGIAVLASPCAYDTDPREPTAVAAIIAKLSSDAPLTLAAVKVHFTNQVSATAP
jgi:hypothetical protein